MLEKFLFNGAMQYAPIAKLSGGERRRLYLLRVLMSAPNVLLLDEPTNDLDIPTMVTLEDYLDGFGGCLIVVSHDRYFLDRTVEHIFRFEGGGRVREYPGNYTAFVEAQSDSEDATASTRKKTAAAVVAPASAGLKEASKRKLSFKERRELEELETRIEEAERRQGEIEMELSAGSSDSRLVLRLYEEREALAARMAADLDRWAELAESA
jgi:ATP-binding cassette subfamily F protein uup